ncbi:unnamed protein product [Cuscuta epithymum]|uniref:Retrovirus-related Pol polyprotein from transposon TNT 1-94-like beta-barrel domain-containing protein n=1 Tax=Cuscuta epithymum TaxID=186058 RepID=A0AAV0DJV3_9ASTE|nr:unnamed protein product [Cuscuta epithymum]
MFGVMRSNILGQEELPSLTKLYNVIVQEERHRNMTCGKEEKPEAAAFAVRQSVPIQDGEQKLVCGYCKKNGHDTEHCFKRTEKYPEWWFDNPGRGHGGRGRGAGRGRGRTVANAIQSGPEEAVKQSKEDKVDFSASRVPPMFTEEQWRVLVKAMENFQVTSPNEKLTGMGTNSAWLLDSGASYNMTGLENVFNHKERVPPLSVTLPNGEITHATYMGHIHLSSHIKLTNVLFVPGLRCNLISLA